MPAKLEKIQTNNVAHGTAIPSDSNPDWRASVIGNIPHTLEEYREWWEANTDVPFGCCWCGCGLRTWVPKYTHKNRGQIQGLPCRYTSGHQSRSRVRKNHIEPQEFSVEDRGYSSPCWIWQGVYSNTGYGSIGGNGAHKVAYEQYNEKVPQGLDLDHLCMQPGCVHPLHMEVVTRAENARRKPGNKLSHDRVRRIRELLNQGSAPKDIARQFGVSANHVRAIRRGDKWGPNV